MKEVSKVMKEAYKYDEYKIYAFKGVEAVFKLHELVPNMCTDGRGYGFIDMNSSCCYANGIYSSAEELIRHTVEDDKDTVYEFDTAKEFLEWAITQV